MPTDCSYASNSWLQNLRIQKQWPQTMASFPALPIQRLMVHNIEAHGWHQQQGKIRGQQQVGLFLDHCHRVKLNKQHFAALLSNNHTKSEPHLSRGQWLPLCQKRTINGPQPYPLIMHPNAPSSIYFSMAPNKVNHEATCPPLPCQQSNISSTSLQEMIKAKTQ